MAIPGLGEGTVACDPSIDGLRGDEALDQRGEECALEVGDSFDKFKASMEGDFIGVSETPFSCYKHKGLVRLKRLIYIWVICTVNRMKLLTLDRMFRSLEEGECASTSISSSSNFAFLLEKSRGVSALRLRLRLACRWVGWKVDKEGSCI